MPPPLVHQRSPYHKQIRDLVAHMHVIDQMTYKSISRALGRRPCAQTVGRISSLAYLTSHEETYRWARNYKGFI